jgi:hypothetical protein
MVKRIFSGCTGLFLVGLLFALGVEAQQKGPTPNAPTSKLVVTSFNGRTGAVTPASGDYSFSMLSGAAIESQLPGTTAFTDKANSFTFSQSITGSLSITGNINLPVTTDSLHGVLTLGGYPFLHSYGTGNTFVGQHAGNFSITGAFNTASGFVALYSNTTGELNTASGSDALYSNTTGNGNTAGGVGAALMPSTPTPPDPTTPPAAMVPSTPTPPDPTTPPWGSRRALARLPAITTYISRTRGLRWKATQSESATPTKRMLSLRASRDSRFPGQPS